MFTQDELKQAAKQMRDAQRHDRNFGRLAATHLNTFLKNCKAVSQDHLIYGINFKIDEPARQKLIINLSPYDNWRNTLKILEKNGVKYKISIQTWKGTYDNVPIGNLDLTLDPKFAQARQKNFNVYIVYSDPGFF